MIHKGQHMTRIVLYATIYNKLSRTYVCQLNANNAGTTYGTIISILSQMQATPPLKLMPLKGGCSKQLFLVECVHVLVGSFYFIKEGKQFAMLYKRKYVNNEFQGILKQFSVQLHLFLYLLLLICIYVLLSAFKLRHKINKFNLYTMHCCCCFCCCLLDDGNTRMDKIKIRTISRSK